MDKLMTTQAIIVELLLELSSKTRNDTITNNEPECEKSPLKDCDKTDVHADLNCFNAEINIQCNRRPIDFDDTVYDENNTEARTVFANAVFDENTGDTAKHDASKMERLGSKTSNDDS